MAIQKAQFISAQYIKDNNVLNDNIDNKYVNTGIDLATNLSAQDLLGSPLFDAIYAEVFAESVSAANQALLDNLNFKNFMAWSVIAHGTLWMTYKYQNKSVASKNSPPEAEGVDNYTIDKLVSDAKNKANFFGERVIYFIKQNIDDYPLYSECGDMPPAKTAYRCPIYFKR